MTDRPKSLEKEEAAQVLERTLGGTPSEPKRMTIADAATRSGLPLRDAESGLLALVSTYRGHLRVTEDGDLLFLFPHGFTQPWRTRTRIEEAAGAVGKAVFGAARFVVRAWIAIVLVAYVAIFLAIAIGMTVASSNSSSDRDRRSFGFAPFLFRIVFDALFWTFHPFSPFALVREERFPVKREKREPFYERVNRYFFGPEEAPVDPREMERRILAEVRAQKGRIGVGDVIRVTGLPREKADPLMAKLLLDYDGDVDVSDEGGIVYRFEAMRKTLEGQRASSRPRPIWTERATVPPLTGNTPGSNVLISLLNGFNLVMSVVALRHDLTLAKAWALVQGVPRELMPEGGFPVALGIVPFVFSIALFLLPLGRVVTRRFREKRAARENGRRALLRAVLDRKTKEPITDARLAKAYRDAAGTDADGGAITREVVALGGDLDVLDDGSTRYRFPDFETEEKALAAEREASAEEEARVGRVVYSSEG